MPPPGKLYIYEIAGRVYPPESLTGEDFLGCWREGGYSYLFFARAKGMAEIARETGLGRESLYKALSPEGNPEFATVLKVVRALGLRLRATPAHALIGRRRLPLNPRGWMRFAFPPYALCL